MSDLLYTGLKSDNGTGVARGDRVAQNSSGRGNEQPDATITAFANGYDGPISRSTLAATLLRQETENFPTSFSPSNPLKRDCEREIVYSMSDEQCRVLCRGAHLFTHRNGICVNTLNSSHAKEITCDASLGVVAYISGDAQFGQANLRCLSVDPGIQPDDADGINKIVRFGKTSQPINYLESYPRYQDTVCDAAYPLATLVFNTETVRSYKLCVSSVAERFFAFNDMLV